MRRELAFWLTVGIVAVVAVTLTKIAGNGMPGEKFPPLHDLAQAL